MACLRLSSFSDCKGPTKGPAIRNDSLVQARKVEFYKPNKPKPCQGSPFFRAESCQIKIQSRIHLICQPNFQLEVKFVETRTRHLEANHPQFAKLVLPSTKDLIEADETKIVGLAKEQIDQNCHF